MASHTSSPRSLRIASITTRGLIALVLVMMLWACANVGNPEGGPYDMDPPRLVQARPAHMELNVKQGRIKLTFDEYIKLSQQDKVIVSPPQTTPPNMAAVGKSINIRLQDSLRPNTTYSIYFDDAVVDNNEDNPLENFAYTFSTGPTIDSMQISGVVLDAYTLEPVGGVVLGAYLDEAGVDSAVLTRAFPFASKTNKMGLFTIRGLKDSTYRVYALKDDDNDYRYRPDAEGFAFDGLVHRTSKLDSLRTDTIKIDSIVRRDTLWRDSLVTYGHTYYYPDNLVLRYYQPMDRRQGIERHYRKDTLSLHIDYYTKPSEEPRVRSLDLPDLPFDSLFYTSTQERSTAYWVRHRELMGRDSIRLEVSYMRTDSLLHLQQATDTLVFHKPKVRAKPHRKQEKEPNPFTLTLSGARGVVAETLRDSLILTSSLPIAQFPEGAIRLEHAVDSAQFEPLSFALEPAQTPMSVSLLFTRAYGAKYRLRIDSAALHSIYGHACDSVYFEQKTQPEAELGQLQVAISGLEGRLMVELLDKSGSVLLAQQAVATDSLPQPSTAPQDSMLTKLLDRGAPQTTDTLASEIAKSGYRVEFVDLKPSDYYLRLYVDTNGDGQWTAGLYPSRQPEMMYYSPASYSVKKGFTTSEAWKPLATPLDKQKPEALRKVKPETKKERVDKNIEYYRQQGRKKKK